MYCARYKLRFGIFWVFVMFSLYEWRLILLNFIGEHFIAGCSCAELNCVFVVWV